MASQEVRGLDPKEAPLTFLEAKRWRGLFSLPGILRSEHCPAVLHCAGPRTVTQTLCSALGQFTAAAASLSCLTLRHLKAGGVNDIQVVPVARVETPAHRNPWGSSEALVNASEPLGRSADPQPVLPLTGLEPVTDM